MLESIVSSIDVDVVKLPKMHYSTYLKLTKKQKRPTLHSMGCKNVKSNMEKTFQMIPLHDDLFAFTKNMICLIIGTKRERIKK